METYNLSLLKLNNQMVQVRYRNADSSEKDTIQYFVSQSKCRSDGSFHRKTKEMLDLGLDPFKFMSIEMLDTVSGKTRDEARAKAIEAKRLYEEIINITDEYTLIK